MSFTRGVWIVLAAVHLGAVICGALYWQPRDRTPVARYFRAYGMLSGAKSSYGFFAPEVGARHRATFFLQDRRGATWTDVLDHARSAEARLRLSGIVEDPFMSGQAAFAPEWRKDLVSSWAATMFRRHPTADHVTIVVEFYDVPALHHFRAGSRPKWVTVYRAWIRCGQQGA